MAAYRSTRTPGIHIRHKTGCPAEHEDGPRCRCKPTYRAKITGNKWSPTYTEKAAAIAWKAQAHHAANAPPKPDHGPTFGELALEWWQGVQSGTIGKRKGRKGATYSPTTLAGYSRSLRYTLAPYTFNGSGDTQPADSDDDSGVRPTPSDHEHEYAAHLTDEHWQRWVDRMAREGLSRSRIANHLAVVSAIYGWASRATRRLVPHNPTLTVELPPTDSKPRERVADADEAARLLAALAPDDAVPYALAFYTGMRRSEIARLDWLDVDLERMWVTVRVSKSEAGTLRSMPLAAPLKPILLAARLRQGRPDRGRVTGSAMSGKLGERAMFAWGWTVLVVGRTGPTTRTHRRGHTTWVGTDASLDPIGLHECRHTYASFLVAAGYDLKSVMSYLGHADLQTTSRYVHRLAGRNEDNAADRLNDYLEGSG